MGDGGGGDNWCYKMCKAPVKLLPSTNQHPTSYRPNALPDAQPTVSSINQHKSKLRGEIPDKIRHASVRIINSTKTGQNGHYCNSNDTDATNALLY